MKSYKFDIEELMDKLNEMLEDGRTIVEIRIPDGTDYCDLDNNEVEMYGLKTLGGREENFGRLGALEVE